MIYWHSGTGNSRHVAEALAQSLGLEAVMITPGGRASDAPAGEKTVWVFPVYSWGVPPVVRRFIENSEGLGGSEHYMVCTCGDDVGLTALQWRKLLRRKGWRARGAWSVQMPNNYVLLPGFDVDSAAVRDAKLSACDECIKAVARGIRCGANVDDVVRGSLPWLKSKVLYPLFVRMLMSPKPFHSTDSCIGCGKCAAACPARNIVMDGRRPVWGRDCTMCLGCYHICPKHAVGYGSRTKSKGQYLYLPSVNNDVRVD